MDGEAATVRPSEAKAYFNKARDWEANREWQLTLSERRAWRVASAACIVGVLALVGLVVILPLKTAVPYVLAVDKATGHTEVIDAIDDRTLMGYQELLDKHWAQRYVLARESYVYKLLQTDYNTTLALSTDAIGRTYAAQFDGPNARDKKLGQATEVQVRILSITLAPDRISSKAVIRYESRTVQFDTGIIEAPQTYVATLAYEYRPSMLGKEKDLIDNPLGYRVTSYRVDSELNLARAAPAAETYRVQP